MQTATNDELCDLDLESVAAGKDDNSNRQRLAQGYLGVPLFDDLRRRDELL